MKIVFFGSPAAALPSLQRLLEVGHSIELVITQPDKPAGRGRRLTPCAVKSFALEHQLPTLEPVRIRKDESILGKIQAARPDIHVVVAYGQIIPAPIIYFPHFHSLNVHFSLLPKYRGAAPVQWTILNGETETGVTIMELNEKMDEGDILSQARTDIGERETAPELEARLAATGADLLLETIRRIEAIKPIPQDHSLATLAPKIRKEDGLINWADPAGRVERKVRALAHWPGAFTFFHGRRLQIHRGQNLSVRRHEGEPGEVMSLEKGGLGVACGDGGTYLIEEVQPEGKTGMSAYVFSLGAKMVPGTLLGGT
jgi:methionyl-tRNA formyltransferase